MNSVMHVQMINFPRTKAGMKGSGCWQFWTTRKLVFLMHTSSAAAMVKNSLSTVGAGLRERVKKKKNDEIA